MGRGANGNSGASAGNSPAMGTAIAPEAVDTMSGDSARSGAMHWWWL